MQLRKVSAAIAFVAVAGLAGALGQSLTAQAGSAALTDKTIYGKVNVSIGTSDVAPDATSTLLTITVHAPSAGQALVSFNGQVWTDFPDTTTNRIENIMTLARCGAPNTITSQCAAPSNYWFHKEPNADTYDSTFPFSLTSQLNFSGAGNRVLYINATANNYEAGLYGDPDVHLDVQFTPKNPISNSAQVTISAAVPLDKQAQHGQ